MKAKPKKKRPTARVAHEPGDLFRALADATYDWETWMGARGRLLWVNPAVERMTGYSVAECMRMKRYPLPLLHPEDHAKMAEVVAAARAGTPGNDVELRVLRKDGTTRWAAISWQSFLDADGTRRGYRTSVRDIHERKLAEERLGEALRLVEQAAIVRNEFLANMSHELRTPLQCILGYSQLLRASEPDPERARKLDVVSEQTEHLLTIIGDVLDMAALQVAAPELAQEDFDLREKIGAVIAALTPLSSGKGLAIVCEVDPDIPAWLSGDRLRLRQVLTNLIGNAVKFTSQGTVTVRARVSPEPLPGSPRPTLVVEVEDTGIGIAPEALEHVFEPFVQADNTIARRYGGTGLGLPIAKRLAEAMGGRVSVTSEFGHGTCLRLELPLTEAAGHGVHTIEAPPQTLLSVADLRVLVVDDGPPVRELTCDMLRALGLQPEAAASGREAVAIAKANPFDLILMDLQMPDLDGLTAAQLIRAQKSQAAPRPFIVALTADVFGRALALGPSGGMDGFLVKPVRLSDLRSLLERFQPKARGGREVPSVVTDAPPARSRALLEQRVVRELREMRTRDGRTMLEVTGGRVLEDTATLLSSCRAACVAGDMPQIARLAHRIKGNCLVIGATDAAGLAQRLDDLAQAGDQARVHETLDTLEVSFSSVCDAVKAAILQPVR